jgi:DNA-binding XRE family transcriptional regulator
MNGIELKVERIRVGVPQHELATALGVSRQTVIAWERAHIVSPDRVTRYREALSGLSRMSTEATA